MIKIMFLVVCLTFTLGTFSVVCAQDFGIALTKAFSEIPDGADVASMGNASTATPAFSSRNPAIVAVEVEDVKTTVGATGTYGYIHFGNGPSVNLYSGSLAARLPYGTVQITYSNGSSDSRKFTDSDTVKFDEIPSVELQYGFSLGKIFGDDALYGGVSYGYSESKLTLNNVTFLSEGLFRNTIVSEGSGHTFGTGMLYQIYKAINLGALYLHSWDGSRESVTSNGAVVDILRSKSQADELRVGIGIQVTPITFVAGDYRHLYLPDGQRDDQYYAGIEQGIIKDVLYIYGGWANGGTTTGIGLYFKHGGVNLAYMHRPMRALEEHLGKAEVFAASLYLNM